MKESRIIGILLTDLTSNKLKLEEELERLLNINKETNKKVKVIKKILVKIIEIDACILKIKSYINEPDAKQLLTDSKPRKK